MFFYEHTFLNLSRTHDECRDRPGVVQLPALSVVILLQAFEPVCGLTQPGAVQQVLEGRWHVQVLVYGEGHAVVQVVEEVVRPLVDGARWVVHGYLQSKWQNSSQGSALRGSGDEVLSESSELADLVERLAGVHGVPAAGLSD